GAALRRPLREPGAAAGGPRVQLTSSTHGLAPTDQRACVMGRHPPPRRFGGLGLAALVEALLVEALSQRVPRQRGPLDPDREPDDALQGGQVAQGNVWISAVSRGGGAVAVAVEAGLVHR